MAENLERRWGLRVVPVHFSGGTGNQKTLATTLKWYMEKGRVKFYPDKARNYQMHSVKKQVTQAGNVGYVVARGKADATGHKHHADVFWSRALAVWCHSDIRALGRPRVRFI